MSSHTAGAGPGQLASGAAGLAPGSARSLLITILGELVWPTGGPVWTSALVYILKGLGVEEQTARQAIARAGSSDWIVGERRGHEVSWSLTSKLTKIFEVGQPRVQALSDPFSSWDGQWVALFITIPQSHRNTRRPFYTGLTWAGFGNPAPGLWLSPHTERADEVAKLVKDLDLAEHTVSFLGSLAAIGMSEADIVSRGWDLEALRTHYEQVLDIVADLRPAPGDETLLTHIRVLNEWQELPRTDPQLPEALLPDWIGRNVARRIEALRAQWSPAVRRRFAEINTPAVPA
jgi:phenylacetic acid degradation operon negative regulatory protein